MKNYFVIGASSGIGKELVHQLTDDGNHVYATYFENKIVSEIKSLEYHYLNAKDEVYDLDFLPEQLDGLVYCPGSINLKPFHRIKNEDFIADFNFQVGGAIKIIQQCLHRLKAAKNSSIVLFSTVAVQFGFNFHSQVSVSKGAIEGLTKALAAEFAPGIRVNTIAPSLTNTPLASKLLNTDEKIKANAQRHPLRRIGDPTDIAAMAKFLLSDDTSWMSGQILHVDGGMSSLRI